MFIAVCGIIFGCAANGFAQVDVPMVGGYAKVNVADRTVVAAANFAVKAQAKKQKSVVKLIAVNNAASQVVAGMNYQICLSVETTDRKTKTAVSQIVQAIVYQNLQNKLKLMSWTVAACADVAPIVPIN